MKRVFHGGRGLLVWNDHDRELLPEELSFLRTVFPKEDYRGRSPTIVRVQAGSRIIGIAGVFRRYRVFRSMFILVSEDMRGRGIGSLLMEEVLAGSRYMLLSTAPSNRMAIRLYRKFGFRAILPWRNRGESRIIMLRISPAGVASRDSTVVREP